MPSSGGSGAGAGRWRAVDLELGGEPLGGNTDAIGFSPRQSASLGVGRTSATAGGNGPAGGVERRLDASCHGQASWVLRELVALPAGRGAAGPLLWWKQNYFAVQAGRMNCDEGAQRGWSIGSGPVESTCQQWQCRRKREGQFWTAPGLRHSGVLEEARNHARWVELWMGT